MFNLTNINELEQFIGTLEPTQWLIIDVPDIASPTGFTSYKVAPTLLNGTTTFELLTDTPNSYIGQAGKGLIVNVAENGLEFTDTELYNSGWKTIPVYNGSYGFADTGVISFRPQISIIGKVLYMNGRLQFPMPTVAGGSILDTNGSGYVQQSKMFSDLYLGVGDGYDIGGNKAVFTRSAILPTALLPTEIVRSVSPKQLISKTKYITGSRMKLSHFIASSEILPDGRIVFGTIEQKERDGLTGPTGWEKNIHIRKIVDRFDLGDNIIKYDNYRNAFDGAGVDNLRTPSLVGYTAEYNYDGSKPEDLGGFVIELNTSYPLDSNLTQEQIKTAFDSL